jgi:KDO2-lipid IV(A) lauroyltransferase
MKKNHIWEARLVLFFSWLPLSWVLAIATTLAQIFCLLPVSIATAHRRVLINTLICFPEKSLAQARKFARRSFIETARTLAGYSHVWLRPVDEILTWVTKVHGEKRWHEAVASKRPVLYLSLHQSSWEVPVLMVGKHDPGTLVMYQPAGDSALEDLVKEGRQGTGCVLVPTNGEGVRAALAGLEKGKSMALLADHQPGGKSNPYVPFFGHEVMMPAFVHKVIQRYQPHVFFVSAQRDKNYKFELYFEEAPAELMQMNERQALGYMSAAFEKIIRRNPEQYQWTYRRFRRSRNGARGWYNKPEFLQRVIDGESPSSVFSEDSTPV